MKFSLTISDATKEEIEAFFGGARSLAITDNMIADHDTRMAQIVGNTSPAPTNGHDDESGPTNSNAPNIDSAGFPWDERIHSKTKATNSDGTWRKRRGVTDAAIAAIEAELRSRGSAGMYMQQPANPPMPNQPQYQQQPVQPQFTQPIQQPQYQQPAATQQMSQQPQYQPQYQQQPTMDFPAFMQHLTVQMQKRDQNGMPLIETNYLANVAQRISVATGKPITNITDVQHDPVALAHAVSIMTQDGRWL